MREDKPVIRHFLSHESLEPIRRQVEQRAPPTERAAGSSVHLLMSQGCKRVLAHAAEEAGRLSHRVIGTDHLLLGLLRDEVSFSAQLLHQFGLSLTQCANTPQTPAPSSMSTRPRVRKAK